MFLLLLGAACASVEVHEQYKDMEEAMEAEVETLVDKIMPAELNKDPDKTNFEAIRSSAMSVRSLFIQARDPKRALYLRSKKYRTKAKTAAGWFRDIAAAATLKQHAKLVDLYKPKTTICTSCHKHGDW